jgi:hypothetical protein
MLAQFANAFCQIKPQTPKLFIFMFDELFFHKYDFFGILWNGFDMCDGEARIIGHHCIMCNIFCNRLGLVKEHKNSKNHIKTTKHA